MVTNGLEKACRVPVSSEVTLEGDVCVPEQARGMVLFAHGSGSSRRSPRNKLVAQHLNQAGIATLLLDLLTAQEEKQDSYTGKFRFNIDLLSERVAGATTWLREYAPTKDVPLGYFGASTGAAAALVAGAQHPQFVKAIVSRGGRPDMAGEALQQVCAPTLLIVGAEDTQVITLNQMAYTLLKAEKRFELVLGATHLFEEPGALERVAQLACCWFRHYLIT